MGKCQLDNIYMYNEYCLDKGMLLRIKCALKEWDCYVTMQYLSGVQRLIMKEINHNENVVYHVFGGKDSIKKNR